MIKVQDCEVCERAQVPQELIDKIVVKEEDREPMLACIDRMLNEPGVMNLDMADVEPFFERGCEYMVLKTDSATALKEIDKWLDGKEIGKGDAAVIYMEGDVGIALLTDATKLVSDRVCFKKENGSLDEKVDQPDLMIGASYRPEDEPNDTAVTFNMWLLHSKDGKAVRTFVWG